MNFNKLEIPKGTKLYRTLSNCCRHQNVLPTGVQAVIFSTGEFAGFAKLPQKIGGDIIIWYTP